MMKYLGIQTVLKEKQRSLIAPDYEPNCQQHPFKEEIRDPLFFVNNETQDIVWIDVCHTPKATRWPDLVL